LFIREFCGFPLQTVKSVTMAATPNVNEISERLNSRIVGSNLTHGINIRLFFCVSLSVGGGLAMSLPPTYRVLPMCEGTLNEKEIYTSLIHGFVPDKSNFM